MQKIAPLQRPYQTLYYSQFGLATHDSQGHAKTEKGAIRASVVRVFDGEYVLATIHENDVVIYTVKRTKTGIDIFYGGRS